MYEFKNFLQTFPITQLGKITIDLMAFKKDIASQPPPRKTFALTNIAPPLPRSGDYLKDKLIIFSSIICVSCWLKELLGCKSLTHYFSGIYGTSVVDIKRCKFLWFFSRTRLKCAHDVSDLQSRIRRQLLVHVHCPRSDSWLRHRSRTFRKVEAPSAKYKVRYIFAV